ncbi:hypothetical protein BC829DRAFT_400987 [Chytridium lagenaria]|nr:hypothetical protein BC829DRAFT_400987 [Chytridium lagenaria]
MDYQRKLFEELMNPLIGATKSYKDKDVCRYQMVAFCPHELFTNTKVDLGNCSSKVHDERLRETSPDKGHLGWEQAFANFLTKLVFEMDRSIQKGKERINTTGPVGPDDPAAIMAAAGEAEQEERIVFLEEQAKTLTVQMEEYGEMGEVDKAQELLAQVESLKQNIATIKNTIGRKLTICEVCSACLVANETAQRMDAHLIGKQHTGYLKIRQWLDAWKKSPFYVPPKSDRDFRNRESNRDRDSGRRDFDRGRRFEGERGDRDFDDRRGGWNRHPNHDRGFERNDRNYEDDHRGNQPRGPPPPEWRTDRERRPPPPSSRYEHDAPPRHVSPPQSKSRNTKWDERPLEGNADDDHGKRSQARQRPAKDVYERGGRDRDARELSPVDYRRRR